MKHILYLIIFNTRKSGTNEDFTWGGEERLDLTCEITEDILERSISNFDYHHKATENDCEITTQVYKLTEIKFD